MTTQLPSVRSLRSPGRISSFAGVAAIAVLLSGGMASAGDVFVLENSPGNSLRSFPANDPTNQTPIGGGTPLSFVLEFNTPGTILWGIDEATGRLGTFDTTDATFTPGPVVAGILAGHTVTGLSMDPTDGTLFLSTTDIAVSTIYRLDPGTAVATPVGNAAGLAHIDIAIDCAGQMYAHDILTDSLYTVDKNTGASVLIGPTGFNANFAQGMDFDYSDGTLYATLFDTGAFGTQFVTFDLDTGAATPITFFAGEEFEMAVRGPCRGGQDRGGPSDKGSLLVYPKVELRWENVPPFNLIQDTFLHLTNDFPGNVSVKLFFFNGDAPIFSAHWDGDPETDLEGLGGIVGMLRDDPGTDIGQAGGGDNGARDHPGWNSFDNIITLTANEPAYWAASTGLPKGVGPFLTLDPGPPPGRPDPNDPSERLLRGFVVAFAVDQVSGEEIRWNHLTGDGTILNYTREEAWQYGAPAFQVVNAAIANGEPTGTPGRLNLDGLEYAESAAELLMNFVSTDSEAYSGDRTITHDTDLTLMPVYWDFRQETTGPRTVKASFDIWNENEVKFTNLDRCVTCWDQELLSNHAIPNHFLISALHTNAGKARMDGLASFLCPESLESSLIGVAAKLMYLDVCCDGDRIASGTNLISVGRESGLLLYDVSGPPPESRWETSSLK